MPDDGLRRSYEELQVEVARYRAVYEVMRALGGTLDLDELLDLIITRVTEAMDADRSSLFLIDWETEQLCYKLAISFIKRSVLSDTHTSMMLLFHLTWGAILAMNRRR